MKKYILILVMFFLPIINAIQITEVELNPLGDDKGNEWVELYSEEEVNLTGYKIVNNDGEEINLNGNLEGYYVYIFEKQWLDNSDEKIFLYYNNELIDETEIFKDDKNNDLTWQFCNNQWLFANSTKNEGCKKREKEESIEDIEDIKENKSLEIESVEILTEESKDYYKLIRDDLEQEKIIENSSIEKLEVINLNNLNNLNTKDIKTDEVNKELKKSNYSVYGLIGFSILLCCLFLIKKYQVKKNEFR
ncbi:MAG TPA: lamin tail domain-containing protein [Nanoarchaeota archaeon]|nr:lamin tail domain-containing protein [Nanoarchaeota archaeon]HIH62788.1 lamin tail domain-containing protein [Nanoarchaeota archaeon]HIJ10194.1 lamin tail domain-containing protein [Nanoarchaeota archaeon]